MITPWTRQEKLRQARRRRAQAWARRGWSNQRMDKRLNSSGNEQKNRGDSGRSRVEQRNNFRIESLASQSPYGRQSVGRVASSYTTICNSGHRTTNIDNTAGNSHTHNNSKHNELNHARIEGPVSFGYTTNYYFQKHERLEKIGALGRQPREYNEGLSKTNEPILSPERPSTNEDSFNEFQLAPELPFPRNQYFCGREDLIDRIHSIFHPSVSDADMTAPTARLLIALHGLGGIGKTQIALEYAHRYEHLYSAILWVDGKDRTVLESSGVRILQQLVYHYTTRCPANPDYTRIANELGIPGGIDISGTIKQDAVNSNSVWRGLKQWLQKKGNVRWLLLFDNYDDLEAVNLFNYLPTANWGRIIVTSRRSEIQFLGYSLPVEEVPTDVGRAMLTKGVPIVSKDRSATEIKDMDEVVAKLGGLPLAINQAAAYIAMTQIDCKTYLRKLEANFKRIASTRPTISTYRNDSVFTCWEISFAALCPSAAQLLHLCAFLSNEDIPDELFHRGRTGVIWLNDDDGAFDIAIENLFAFSLVKRKATSLAECDSFWIHPIVHQWAREHLNVDDQRVNAGNAISLISTAVVTESIQRDREYWEFERRISNHIDLCFQNISKFYGSIGNEYPTNILRAVSTLGAIDILRSRYDRSAQWLQRALDGYENALGKHHTSTLTTVSRMASVFESQGEYAKAHVWYQRALDGTEKALGKHHPSTLATVNNLALLFEKQGEYAKALEWYQRALDGYEKALGKHHPSTLTTVHNLAHLFENQGEHAQALEWYQRALDGTEKALGKHHPDTLTTVHNLALLFEKQGEYAQALEWYQRALVGSEKALGMRHPLTISSANMLARLRAGLASSVSQTVCQPRLSTAN